MVKKNSTTMLDTDNVQTKVKDLDEPKKGKEQSIR